MTISKLVQAAVFVTLTMLFIVPASAFADTYQIFDMGGPRVIYGIDNVGDVVIFDPASSCDQRDNPCYDLFRKGAVISFSTVAPALDYDDGMPCTPILPVGTILSYAVCNSGREAFGATFPSSIQGLFTGPDPVADFVHDGTVNFIVMNASGDIAWSSSAGDLEAYDLTSHVPEPNTLALLATGLLAGAGVMRRHLM